MGFGGISIWQLLIILVIIVLLFGTKRLRNIGNDLGTAIRGFRSSLKEPGSEETKDATFQNEQLEKSATTEQAEAAAKAAAEKSKSEQDKV